MTRTITIKEFRIEEILNSCSWLIIGPPGSGKCLDPETRIIMFNGDIKQVRYIRPGDRLMGDDNTVRIVKSVTFGQDEMYKIEQSNGISYKVNKPHILVLKNLFKPMYIDKPLTKTFIVHWLFNNEQRFTKFSYTNLNKEDVFKSVEKHMNDLRYNVDFTYENILEISVKDYLCLPENIRKEYKGYQAKIDFSENVIPPENIDFKKMTINTQSPRNILTEYRKANHLQKLKLLGQVIDQYGMVRNKKNTYDILIGVDQHIISDIVFISRSCGFYTTVEILNNRRSKLIISGKRIFDIPTKLCNKLKLDNIRDIISDIDIKPLGKGHYCGFEIDGNGRFLLGDFTVTHNTSLMENIAYYNKHKYPIARIFIGTETGYKKFSETFHPLYVNKDFDPQLQELHVKRQRKCITQNEEGYIGNNAINIMDDISDNRVFKTELVLNMFKQGSQHWSQIFMLGTQYAIDLPPAIRVSCSYVAIFRIPNSSDREKIYKNFGGIMGSRGEFDAILDQLTGNHTCIIIKNMSQSNELEECVFYYQTKILKPWKFGSKEYLESAKSRYNPKYQERF